MIIASLLGCQNIHSLYHSLGDESHTACVISWLWCYFTLFLWCKRRVIFSLQQNHELSHIWIMHPSHNNCLNIFMTNNKFNSVQHAFLAVWSYQEQFGLWKKWFYLKGLWQRGERTTCKKVVDHCSEERVPLPPGDLHVWRKWSQSVMSDFGL